MHGTKFVYSMTGALALLCIVPMLTLGFSEASIHWAIARSVDLAIPCFLLAFSARPLGRYWPTPLTRWALSNRRYLGINWGIAFLFHGCVILLLAQLYPEPFVSQLTPETINSGLLAFSTTALLLMTSNNWSVKFLRPALWSCMHTLGGYFLLFMLAGAMITNHSKPWIWPYAVLTALLVLLRLYGVMHRLWLWIRRNIYISQPRT